MAKGSVRKKGKKWYYRFYVEDESGNRKQAEFPGTESKAETEGMLRKAMEDYESKKFVAKTENMTVASLLDLWVEEDLKPGKLSNGTVMAYMGAVDRIKSHPIGSRKLRSITADHLQAYVDHLCFGGTNADGTTARALSKGYLRLFSAVLQHAFKFAVFPKKLLSFNPMEYVVWHTQEESYDLFEDEEQEASKSTLTHEQYRKLTDFLEKKQNPALLPVQIAYYTGLRIGEACALCWQDVDLDKQCLTVRRSIRYNGKRHKTEIGATKRKKIRTVDFCDTLAQILRRAKNEQNINRLKYGELYSLNYYKEVKEKNRTYYEVYALQRSEEIPTEYREISLVCLRPDGSYESPSAVSSILRTARQKMPELGDLHFHLFRHTFTTNLLSHGAAPKDVQELLGHADVGTTMNIYAHSTKEAKRTSARLLDKVAGAE
ncbi:MAG: site-specific integrase [Oscillospiraceae bacterium]|nr:site-specific integrase [Oscillospiraceae bacterium]